MRKATLAPLIAGVFLVGLTNSALAEVAAFTACAVKDPGAFVTALSKFYDDMAPIGGADRPTVLVMEALWNGSNPTTHSISVFHNDYAALAASNARIASNPAAGAAFSRTASTVAECPAEGMWVERGIWGNEDADWEYLALYPLTLTDVRAYVKAFDKFAESETVQGAPGRIGLWENRAGGQGYTHSVTFTAPTLAGLNTFLDSLLESDDYADFADDVESIRKLGQGSQARKILTLTPQQ